MSITFRNIFFYIYLLVWGLPVSISILPVSISILSTQLDLFRYLVDPWPWHCLLILLGDFKLNVDGGSLNVFFWFFIVHWGVDMNFLRLIDWELLGFVWLVLKFSGWSFSVSLWWSFWLTILIDPFFRRRFCIFWRSGVWAVDSVYIYFILLFHYFVCLLRVLLV